MYLYKTDRHYKIRRVDRSTITRVNRHQITCQSSSKIETVGAKEHMSPLMTGGCLPMDICNTGSVVGILDLKFL